MSGIWRGPAHRPPACHRNRWSVAVCLAVRYSPRSIAEASSTSRWRGQQRHPADLAQVHPHRIFETDRADVVIDGVGFESAPDHDVTSRSESSSSSSSSGRLLEHRVELGEAVTECIDTIRIAVAAGQGIEQGIDRDRSVGALVGTDDEFRSARVRLKPSPASDPSPSCSNGSRSVSSAADIEVVVEVINRHVSDRLSSFVSVTLCRQSPKSRYQSRNNFSLTDKFPWYSGFGRHAHTALRVPGTPEAYATAAVPRNIWP